MGLERFSPLSRSPMGFPGGSDGKESSCNAGDLGLIPWVGKIPWSRKWQPTPVFLPGKSHPLSMGPQRVIATEHTHTSDPRHRKVPVTAVCHTHAWPLACSSLNFPVQEQLLKLLLSCSSCIVPRISLLASHTLGILLIGV